MVFSYLQDLNNTVPPSSKVPVEENPISAVERLLDPENNDTRMATNVSVSQRRPPHLETNATAVKTMT